MGTAVAISGLTAERYGLRAFLWEFLVFGLKEARACIFAASFFALLMLSQVCSPFGLARYDFICLAAVALQVALVLARIETRDEVLTLCAFHVLGLILELFKTHPSIGSWSYPEEGLLKIGTVPIYSGFMYAAVASYMCQVWRILQMGLVNYPPYWLSVPLCVAIYLNFFTHHFMPDLRWPLMAGVVIVFRRTQIFFTVTDRQRSIPMVLGFALVGFFIWIAENISTFLGAWQYPEQRGGWRVVSFDKITSWFLLVIISSLIVADLKFMREQRRARRSETIADMEVAT